MNGSIVMEDFPSNKYRSGDQVYPNVTMEDLLFETQDNEQTLLTDLKLLLIV